MEDERVVESQDHHRESEGRGRPGLGEGRGGGGDRSLTMGGRGEDEVREALHLVVALVVVGEDVEESHRHGEEREEHNPLPHPRAGHTPTAVGYGI